MKRCEQKRALQENPYNGYAIMVVARGDFNHESLLGPIFGVFRHFLGFF